MKIPKRRLKMWFELIVSYLNSFSVDNTLVYYTYNISSIFNTSLVICSLLIIFLQQYLPSKSEKLKKGEKCWSLT
jgi:hypothetical protein